MTILIKKIGLETKDQLICFDKSFEIIDDLNNRYDWSYGDGIVYDYPLASGTVRKKIIDDKYLGRKYFAKFIGRSRIDGSPIFIIDTLQLERDEKISEILK